MLKGSNISQHLMASLKVFGYYLVTVFMGVLMAGSFVNIFAEHPIWFIVYCILFLLFFSAISYSEMHTMAQKDLRYKVHNEDIAVYKLKGLVVGLITSVPFVIMTILYLANNWEQLTAYRVAYRLTIGLFMAFDIYFGKVFPATYVLILLYIPVICMLGYIAGLNKFYVSHILAKIFPAPVKKTKPVVKKKQQR